MTMLSGDALRAELSRRAFLGYGAAFGALGIAAPALLATGARAATPDGEVLTGSHWGVGEGSRAEPSARRRARLDLFAHPHQISNGPSRLPREGARRRSGRPRDGRLRARHLGPGARPGRQGIAAGREDLWPRGDLRRLLWLEEPGAPAQLPESAASDDEPEGQFRERLGRLFDRRGADHHAARRRLARSLRAADGVADRGRQD